MKSKIDIIDLINRLELYKDIIKAIIDNPRSMDPDVRFGKIYAFLDKEILYFNNILKGKEEK